MAPKKPWKTSDGIIETVKRQIAAPIAQGVFEPADILLFADEEMQTSQVPSILEYNQEYLVYSLLVPLEQNITRYPVPDRAIGMKLRDIQYVDTEGNMYPMTRVDPDAKGEYQQNLTTYASSAMAFYFENNDVVLSPGGQLNTQGYLCMSFYLRPNCLVPNEQASIVEEFKYEIALVNADIEPGDVFSVGGYTFTAVTSSPGDTEFVIEATGGATATNLAAVISDNISTIDAQADGTTVVMTSPLIRNFIGPKSSNFANLSILNVSNTGTGFTLSDDIKIVMTEEIDTEFFSNDSLIDFLETSGGHKIRMYDSTLKTINGSEMTVAWEEVPYTMLPGDYICNQYECIIPFLPTDLHTTLCQRTAERMLASIGDKEGAAEMAAKIQRNEAVQPTMVDNRAEGAPQKIVARHSLLRYRRNSRNY